MKLFDKFRKSSTDHILAKMLRGAEAPTFSQLTVKILQKVRDPETEISELSECLQWDPGLVIRILRTVNSSAYGPTSPIQNVHHAVNYMGRAQLEQMVLALAVRNAVPSEPAAGFEPQRFWVAASRRATLARDIAERLHPASSAECFTAGLLQDVALPVLAHARPKEYEPILTEWQESGEGLSSLERDVFGWTHAEAGGLLGKSWELPKELADSIFHHHRSDVTDSQLAPALKLVANLGETERQLGSEGFVEMGAAEYGLEKDWLSDTLVEAEEKALELSKLMS